MPLAFTEEDFLVIIKLTISNCFMLKAVKQKLHIKSRGAAEDAMMAEVKQEEDKAKMLLGAKLLVSI